MLLQNKVNSNEHRFFGHFGMPFCTANKTNMLVLKYLANSLCIKIHVRTATYFYAICTTYVLREIKTDTEFY